MKRKWNPCCPCCIKLRTGAVVVATLEIVLYAVAIPLFSLASSMLEILSFSHVFHDHDGEQRDQGVVEQGGGGGGDPGDEFSSSILQTRNRAAFQILFTLSLFSLMGFVGGILLAVGLKRRKPFGGTCYFKFWMALKILQFLVILTLIVLDLVKTIWRLRLTYFLLWIGLSLYFFIVVLSHFYEIQSKLVKTHGYHHTHHPHHIEMKTKITQTTHLPPPPLPPPEQISMEHLLT